MRSARAVSAWVGTLLLFAFAQPCNAQVLDLVLRRENLRVVGVELLKFFAQYEAAKQLDQWLGPDVQKQLSNLQTQLEAEAGKRIGDRNALQQQVLVIRNYQETVRYVRARRTLTPRELQRLRETTIQDTLRLSKIEERLSRVERRVDTLSADVSAMKAQQIGGSSRPQQPLGNVGSAEYLPDRGTPIDSVSDWIRIVGTTFYYRYDRYLDVPCSSRLRPLGNWEKYGWNYRKSRTVECINPSWLRFDLGWLLTQKLVHTNVTYCVNISDDPNPSRAHWGQHGNRGAPGLDEFAPGYIGVTSRKNEHNIGFAVRADGQGFELTNRYKLAQGTC